jgi:hypothetical protein
MYPEKSDKKDTTAEVGVIECDIIARKASHAAALAEIARACAFDLGQSLRARSLLTGESIAGEQTAVLTLRLPAELAAAQHPVWCLACRLACFLPSARVSVLVEATEAFRQAAVQRPRRSRARTA